MIRLKIEGTPVSASRPRVVRLRNGRSHTFNSAKYANWKSFAADQIAIQTSERIEGALCVTITFWLDKPKSAKKRVYPEVKPDIDNMQKAVLDCINLSGRCWKDDAQITTITAKMRYCEPFQLPRVEVTICEEQGE